MAESQKPQLRIYLASPYGFSPQWQRLLLPEFIRALESLGLEVWEPFERNGQVVLAQPGWAHQVAQRDLQDEDADGLFAIVNGTPPDEGVMVELGAAIALGKPTFLYRDDFRRCTDSEDYPLNLMLFSGLPLRVGKTLCTPVLIRLLTPERRLHAGPVIKDAWLQLL